MNLTLDLHGVRHQDVPHKVDQFIGYHLTNGSREVNIIVGHSERMKEIVDVTLIDYNLKSEYTFFSKTTLLVKLV